jgi:phospholipid/cholesterol/gamma-HCH transport system ATP-binding protein
MNSVIEIGQKVIFLYKGDKLWEGSKENITKSDIKELNDFVFANRMMKLIK